MSDTFYPGQKNYIPILNTMYDNFAAGPYSSVPLSGGTMTGALFNSVGVFASSNTSTNFQGISSCLLNVNASTQADPTAGQFVEAARIAVRGVPAMGYFGSWRMFTSAGSGGLDYSGHALGFFASDNQGGGGFSINPKPTLKLYGTGNVDVLGRLLSAGVVPDIDNGRTLGTSSLRFNALWVTSGTISTSDQDLKTDFRDMTSDEISAAKEVAKLIRIYKWKDSVEMKGDKAREHVGPTVQAVIEVMQSHNLDPFNYGFICYDEWDEYDLDQPDTPPEDAEIGEDTATKGRVISAGKRYAFRYDQLAMFVARGQEARITALEALMESL